MRGSGRFLICLTHNRVKATGFNPLHCGAVVASGNPFRHACFWGRFQSPSLRGSGRFNTVEGGYSVSHSMFQSPSLRGSGRFARGFPGRSATSLSFNPLHCGAVVASPIRIGRGRPRPRVSIPFIAGQWSLRGAGRNRPDHGRSFNPLHCGAVVASLPAAGGRGFGEEVSIPFIAGQWSLL